MSNPSARDGIFNPTSPHSSSGIADSFRGTPDTRFTAFSPEDGLTKSTRVPHSAGANGRGPVRFEVASPASLNIPASQAYGHVGSSDNRDPFVSSSDAISRGAQRLSPTATSFSPSGAVDVRNQTADFEVPSQSSRGYHTVVSRAPSTFLHQSLSTELGLSRCVVAAKRRSQLKIADIDEYISILAQRGYQIVGCSQIQSRGDKVYVRFANIRDACLFSQNAHFGGPEWVMNYIHPREFSQAVDPTSGLITAHEGQLALAVFGPPNARVIDMSQVREFIRGVLLSKGDLFAFKVQADGVEGSLLSAIAEYCDNDVSLRAVSDLTQKVIDGFQICMSLHRPDIPTLATLPQDRLLSPVRTTAGLSDFATNFQRMSLNGPRTSTTPIPGHFYTTPSRQAHTPPYHVQPSFNMIPAVYQGIPLSPSYVIDPMSPRTPNALVSAGNYSWAAPLYPQQGQMLGSEYMIPRQFAQPRHDGRRQNATRVQRSPYHHHNVNGQHNVVDTDRIREGIDVRTTIMLRNIPNKVDQALLKRIIDESSWGKYDFMYLRIDFANDCNVGYAFINFVDPLDIIDFVKKRGNQRWNCFKSDKVAEISYATIQGKDCLVQKFRNSSVMLEASHYRPKLYYTSNGPEPELAGQEEPFPEPDNHSKMKRSCENAEHVGLFTPNAGQHFRDEQRRRRSQYDRGTRLAALEEYDYDPSFQTNQPHQSYSPHYLGP